MVGKPSVGIQIAVEGGDHVRAAVAVHNRYRVEQGPRTIRPARFQRTESIGPHNVAVVPLPQVHYFAFLGRHLDAPTPERHGFPAERLRGLVQIAPMLARLSKVLIVLGLALVVAGGLSYVITGTF
jgi:hypothetical protein